MLFVSLAIIAWSVSIMPTSFAGGILQAVVIGAGGVESGCDLTVSYEAGTMNNTADDYVWYVEFEAGCTDNTAALWFETSNVTPGSVTVGIYTSSTPGATGGSPSTLIETGVEETGITSVDTWEEIAYAAATTDGNFYFFAVTWESGRLETCDGCATLPTFNESRTYDGTLPASASGGSSNDTVNFRVVWGAGS